jgi:protein SCO1/2
METVVDPAQASALSEDAFAAMVDALAARPDAHGDLIALLREDHPVYDQRGAAAVVRMRGWILLAFARIGLPDDALLFVLEELDAGHDGYLVAAAACALRSSSSPRAEFAPFVMRAIGNMRYRDEAVAFHPYGAYVSSSSQTTPVRELLATMAWLGPLARGMTSELEALRARDSGIPRKLLPDLECALSAARSGGGSAQSPSSDCCTWSAGLGGVLTWPFARRAASESVAEVMFEDHDGEAIAYGEFFSGQPSIVAFFYTRCDNPLKCSLTVTKLARVQQQLADRALCGRVRTAGITYDPGFDLPARLRSYGRSRQLRMDGQHRLLRAVHGLEPLRRHFRLGVNFVESLVNRHRIEIYVLDAAGRVAASFTRLRWSEGEVIDRAEALLNDRPEEAETADAQPASPARRSTWPIAGTLASLGVALFPKCPLCWASYMSALGVTGLVPVPYSPSLQIALFVVMALNLASVGWRGRATSRMSGFSLVAAGTAAVVAAKTGVIPESAALWGVALTMVGSVLSVWKRNALLTRTV